MKLLLFLDARSEDGRSFYRPSANSLALCCHDMRFDALMWDLHAYQCAIGVALSAKIIGRAALLRIVCQHLDIRAPDCMSLAGTSGLRSGYSSILIRQPFAAI